MIPMLTVFKNKAIIKNIFIILNNTNNVNDDQTLLVGRHPNCNIVLTHPSISRFHLTIRFTPSSCSLSLRDLSSVHGTWVCGRKLEPGVSVDLKEGDTFTIGVSSRVYLLRFVSQLDVAQQQQHVQLVKDIGSFCCDEERNGQSTKDETFGVLNGSFGTESETSYCDGSSSENEPCGYQSPFLSPPYVQSVDETHRIKACPKVEVSGDTNLLCTLKEYVTHNICMPIVEAVQGTNMYQSQGLSGDTFTEQLPSSVEKQHCFSSPTTIDPVASFDENGAAAVAVVISKESEFGCTFRDGDKIEDILITGEKVFNSDDNSDSEFHQTNVVEQVSVDSLSDGEKQDESYEFHQTKVVEQVSVDSLSDGEKQDESCEKCDSKKYSENMEDSFIAAAVTVPEEHELGCTLTDNDRIEDSLTTGAGIFNSENMSLLVGEAIPVTQLQQIKIVEEVAVVSISDGQNQKKCDRDRNSYLTAKSCDDEGKSLDTIVEDTGKSFQVGSLNPSVSKEADLMRDKKEDQTLQSPVAVDGCFDVQDIESCIEEATEKSRDKAASALRDQTKKSRLMTTSNVDTKVEMTNLKGTNIINRSMPKDLFSALDDEEMFTTPNKENSSPSNTFHSQLMRKKGKLEESKHSQSQRSHSKKANFSPNIYPAERSTSPGSNKENQTPKSAQEWKSRRKPLECQDIMDLKKKRVKRVPLQSLTNSEGNRKSGNSGPFSAAKTIDGATARASNCGQIPDKHAKPCNINVEQKSRWDMVVDTSSLLNKESRKALQLLQGLKGTRLIIPGSVTRELGSMKQQYRIFRRTSEAALALEWIEECKEKTKGWIHIQSSMETTPTPTQCQCNEDLILDCALQYRRKENVGHVVLLSDDVTLKIKSMAKGMLCETMQQFRESLVNPLSERFMWPNSSPRGLTWSCQDDVVLREKYCGGLPSKAGLKLITRDILYLHV